MEMISEDFDLGASSTSSTSPKVVPQGGWLPQVGGGRLFEKVAWVVGLFSAICIGSLFHTLGVIIIGAVTATPCCLDKRVS